MSLRKEEMQEAPNLDLTPNPLYVDPLNDAAKKMAPTEDSSAALKPAAQLQEQTDPNDTANPQISLEPVTAAAVAKPALAAAGALNQLPVAENAATEPVEVQRAPDAPSDAEADQKKGARKKEGKRALIAEARNAATIDVRDFISIYEHYIGNSITFGSFLARLHKEPSHRWIAFGEQHLKLELRALEPINTPLTLMVIARDSVLWAEQGHGFFSDKTPKGIEVMRKKLPGTTATLNALHTIVTERQKNTLSRRKPMTRDFYELMIALVEFFPTAGHNPEDLNTIEQIAIRLFCHQYQISFHNHFRALEQPASPKP